METNAKNYIILTYGCQMNVRDSETIAGLLETEGYSAVRQLEEADLVVVNTCSVRHSAENKVYGKLGEIQQLKREYPHIKVAFGGCMAHQPEVIKRIKSKVDLIFGTSNLSELPQLLHQMTESGRRSPIMAIPDQTQIIDQPLPVRRSQEVSAFVNIMYGCNNFCSYCIVPYTRGRERSRTAKDILTELRDLAAQGYKEVTLLGQNVNSYGRGLAEDIDFAGLLQQAAAVEGLERIRFTTSHPRDVSERLIAVMAEEDKICEHIHVALQSGSTAVLKRMNRHYSREDYYKLIETMRAAIPELAISTDIIVGFPGETEQDFTDTLELMKDIRFDSAFTFMFSPRTGTPAAVMEEQLPREVKQRRLTELNSIQYTIAAEKNRQLLGRVVEVLVEGPSKSNPDFLSSRTRGNHIVLFPEGKELTGHLINVRIKEAKTFSIFGELATNE